MLIAPAYQLIDEQLVRKWTNYVERGGHLVLTCRTGQKKRNGQLWEGRWAQPIYPLIGAQVSFFDLLLDFFERGGARGDLQARAATGFVDHVYGLVGQEAVGDVLM